MSRTCESRAMCIMRNACTLAHHNLAYLVHNHHLVCNDLEAHMNVYNAHTYRRDHMNDHLYMYSRDRNRRT